MRKAFSLFTLLTLAFLSLVPSSLAAEGDYDLSIEGVEMASCEQTENLDDPRYEVSFGTSPEDTEYVSSLYRAYAQGEFGASEGHYTNYEMVEIAADGSWFRYVETDNNVSGTSSHRVICLAIDFTAEGDFDELAEGTADAVPTTWESFLAYTGQSFPLSVVAVPSTPMTAHQFIPFFYQDESEQVYTGEVNEDNTLFVALELYENELNPADSLDLIVALDQDFQPDRGMFRRTYFEGITHYNYGPTLLETDESNNTLYVEDFLDPWMDHLPATDVSISSSDENSFTVEWDEVEGAEEYFVHHWRKNLDNLSESSVESVLQTSRSYTATLSEDDYIHCVRVVSRDDSEIYGKSSSDVCMGNLFRDVDDGLWYSAYTLNATQTGIISGYADSNGDPTGYFGPADTITTSQALKMAATLSYRLISADDYAFELPYSIPSDLESHWSSEYILSSSILDYDLVEDLESFDPDRNITRAEMINLIVESMEIEVPDYTSYDLTDISGSAYADEIQLAYDLGIVSGYDGTTVFGPNNSLLRAEAVKIFIEAGNAFTLTWPHYSFE